MAFLLQKQLTAGIQHTVHHFKCFQNTFSAERCIYAVLLPIPQTANKVTTLQIDWADT